MSNIMPDEIKAILGTYGTVKMSGYGSRWYLSDDNGKAMNGVYYRQEASKVMLDEVEKRMWRMAQRLENRSKSYVVKFAGT